MKNWKHYDGYFAMCYYERLFLTEGNGWAHGVMNYVVRQYELELMERTQNALVVRLFADWEGQDDTQKFVCINNDLTFSGFEANLQAVNRAIIRDYTPEQAENNAGWFMREFAANPALLLEEIYQAESPDVRAFVPQVLLAVQKAKQRDNKIGRTL